MKKFGSIAILLNIIVLFSSFSTSTVLDKWTKAYNKDGLVIYTRTVEKGLKEFKAITTVDAKMKTVLAVMKDYKRHPEWMKVMKDCKMVETVNSKSRFLYYSIDFPWPLWDRDMVSQSSFSLNKDGTVMLSMKSAPTKQKDVENHVRIEDAEGFWKVEDLKNDKTKIIYQYKANPVGLPISLVNMYVLEGPKQTFEGLKKQIKLPEYKNPNVDWLYE